MCTTAAYRPVRELIQQERLKDLVSIYINYNWLPLHYFCCNLCFSVGRLTISNNWQEKKKRAEQGPDSGGTPIKEDNKEEKVITIRPLNMGDFREAKNQVNSLSLSRK